MPERFVPVSENRIHRSADLDRALFLHEFLVSQQTSADGLVYYGKAVGYPWIRSRWIGSPAIRSLKRYMQVLKLAGMVEVHREFQGGIRIRLLGSVKFAKPIAAPAVQLALLGRGVKTMHKQPVEKQLETGESTKKYRATAGPIVGPPLAPERSKEQIQEKFKSATTALADAHAVDNSAPMTDQQLQERQELLRQQARQLLKKVKNAG